MSDDVQAAEAKELSLDPFSFLPGVASKITGLGGNAPGHDPNYVFHTPYVRVGQGRATFTLQFSRLRGKKGALFIVVHMQPAEAGAQARLVISERILINRLVSRGGAAAIQFEGFHDVTYALLGLITDETDAEAEGLTVMLDRADDHATYDGPTAEARNTEFKAEGLRPERFLVSLARPTLAEPVSQPCTADQFDEPVYQAWLRRLRLPDDRSRRQWAFVYVLQVLERYGMLQPGAQGLGFGVRDEPVPAFLAASGVGVTATDRPAAPSSLPETSLAASERTALEALRRPAICDDATFDRNMSFRTADLQSVPRDLVNFDFAWSTSVAAELGSVAAGMRFVRDTVGCLRPGGIAVHVTEFDPDSAEDAVETPQLTLFRRRDLERLSLNLISLGHEVAQVKVDPGRAPAVDPRWGRSDLARLAGRHSSTPFGIIARRAMSVL